MSNTALIHGPLPETNYLYKNVVVKGNFPLASLLVHPDTKYTIKHNFDLEGQTIELPPNCILAIDGGMIYNGTLVGDDSILIDVNRLGNVLDNVIQTGTWKKQDVLNSLSIGTVISGDEPQVTITGEDGDAILNFVLPKGDKGDQGDIGDPFTYEDFTLEQLEGLVGPQGPQGKAFEYSDFTQELLESIRGPLGVLGPKGVSILSFTKIGELENDLIYNTTFDDGSVLTVNIPKGEKGDQGPQGDCLILDLSTSNSYTLYNVTGLNTNGAMTQKAVTDSLTSENISYNNILSSLSAENVQGALDTFNPLIHKEYTAISYPSSTISGITMANGAWTSQSVRQIYLIPYTYHDGDKLHIIANNSQPAGYAFLTSDSHTVGDAVPFCDPSATAWTYVNAGETKDVVIPSTCTYIAINAKYGSGSSAVSYLPTVLQTLNASVPQIDDVLNALDNKIDRRVVLNTFNLSDYTQVDCSLNVSTWYKSGNSGRHKAIPVTPGHYYRMICKTGSGGGYTGWLNSNYDGTAVNGEQVPYALGCTRIWNIHGDIIRAPKNAAYLCIVTVGGSEVAGKITSVEEVIATEAVLNNDIELLGEIDDNYTIVDLSAYTPAPGVLSARDSTNKWVITSGYSHIAIPVTAGEKYIVKSSRSIFYGLLQSYSTSSAPVYSSSVGMRVDKNAGIYLIEIPSDCTYIVFTYTSHDILYVPDLLCKPKIISWVLEKMANGDSGVYPQKIRYAHWNVGHFAYWGAHYTLPAYDTTITEEDSPAMQKMYRKFINEVGADIFGIAEYNPEFDLAGNLTKDVLFQNYQNQFIGTKRNYSCNSIFSNLQSISAGEVLYTHRHQDMYYKTIKVKIGGIDVMVVETHLDWHNDEPEGESTTSILQQQQLIAAMSGYDHVIISGDFNVNRIEQYQEFVDAGYTLVSGSYLDIPTYLRYLDDESSTNDDGLYLDNIIVKGFAVSNAKAWDASGWNYGTTAKYILTIKAGSSGGSISVNDTNISVTANESADSVAEKIANNVLIDGWTLTSVNNSVIVECNTVGDNTVPIRFTDGNTGIKLFGIDCPAIHGTDIGLSDHSIISCDLLLLP